MTAPFRGQVFRVDLGYGSKPWLVVSTNARNRNLGSVVAARITTRSKHAAVPTVVPLGTQDPLRGFVLCDDLVQLYRAELTTPIGVLTPTSMGAVSAGLRIALGI
jgi:mRNA interferase MazF